MTHIDISVNASLVSVHLNSADKFEQFSLSFWNIYAAIKVHKWRRIDGKMDETVGNISMWGSCSF